ncbi:MAG: hypothetical protein V4683_10125 [Bacteroidota bacterium]
MSDIFFEHLNEQELPVKSKFTKQNIYHVGTSLGCSCALNYNKEFLAFNPEIETDKKSPTRFIEILKDLTLAEDIEYYCCYWGNWNLPIEHTQEIDIREITLEKNYWGLRENEFIKFNQQPT